MKRRASVVLLRRSVPLVVAVAALVGPETSTAAAPTPDRPASAAPSPDPAPVITHAPRATVVRTPAAAPPRAAPVAAPRPARPAPPPRLHPKPRARAVAVVAVHDVVPLQVDLHPGLAIVDRPDERALLLAGIALLAAACTAGSGALLGVAAVRRA